MTVRYYTTSTAFLEALAEAGVSHAFANLGNAIPALSKGSRMPRPRVVRRNCPSSSSARMRRLRSAPPMLVAG